MAEPVVYLVRHGMHDWLRPGRNRLAGRLPGVTLNADGRGEAQRVAQMLAEKPLTWIASSPLERTVETAEIIARPHGLAVDTDARLIDSGLGPWEGMWVADIVAQYPEQWRTWREDPAALRLPGAETLEQIADRMEAACLAHLERGGQGVIVSHQDPLGALLCRLIGMPLDALRAWDIRTGSVSVLRRTPYGNVVEAVNAGIPLTLEER